jgi:hypothetical protein
MIENTNPLVAGLKNENDQRDGYESLLVENMSALFPTNSCFPERSS